MKRIDREKKVVEQMLRIYCRKHHGGKGLCAECAALRDYAHARLSHCPQGNSKSSCRRCPHHCYAPAQREAIRQVMRYVGPRMIFHHPVAALRHLISEMR